MCLIIKKLFFTVLIILVSFTSRAQNTKVVSRSQAPTVIEEKILDSIFKLQECKERAAYIKHQTKGKQHLAIAIYERPSKEIPYYWVKAWEDNGMNYVTHFNFYVYVKPFKIKYYDTLNDKSISLDEWRHRSKLAGQVADTTVKILWREVQYDQQLKDTVNTIIINESYCNTLPPAARAALGYVATFNGSECQWDGETKEDRSNLKCKLLTALNLGYQCSERHLGFLRHWFREDESVLKTLQNCPTVPFTATSQNTFDEIKMIIKGNNILVWFSANAVNLREHENWSWTERDHFRVDKDKLTLEKIDKSKLKHEKL